MKDSDFLEEYNKIPADDYKAKDELFDRFRKARFREFYEKNKQNVMDMYDQVKDIMTFDQFTCFIPANYKETTLMDLNRHLTHLINNGAPQKNNLLNI